MRTDKKSSNKAEKKSSLRGLRQDTMGYGKKTALLEEAITQMNAGKYGRSSAVLKELLALDPHNMEARRLFATLHLRLGSLIPARQAFDSLIDEAFERQDYWLAESLLREYLAAGPRCVPYLEKLGSLHENKGETIDAVTEYGKAIDILIEDPDPDNPNHVSQLYKKIVDLAPDCPVAVRLAGCFDAQTGELIARPVAAYPEEGAAEESISSAVSGPLAESVADQPPPAVMPWEQVDRAEGGPGATGFLAVEEPPSSSTFPPSPLESGAVLQEEHGYNGHGVSPADTGGEGSRTVSLEAESASVDSAAPGSLAAPQFQEADSPLPATQQDAAAQGVSPPMPWEDIREEKTDIPDQTGTELPDASAWSSVPTQEPAGLSQETSTGGEFSWDSLLKNVWKSGSAPPASEPEPEAVHSGAVSVGDPGPSTLAPGSLREIDPGTIEIPAASRLRPQPASAEDSVVAPMPWDHVQEATIAIPAAQTEFPAVGSPVEQPAASLREAEPVGALHPEPVAEQDRPPSIVATASVEPETSAFSLAQPLPAPPVAEPDLSLVNVPPGQFLADDHAAGEVTEPQTPAFSFAGEAPAPVEPAPAFFSPASALSPSFVEGVPSDTPQADTAFSLRSDARETPVVSSPSQTESQAEPASPLMIPHGSPWRTGGRAAQTDDSVSATPKTISQSDTDISETKPFSGGASSFRIERDARPEPVLTDAKAPLLDSAPKQEEWMKGGESIRFIGEPQASPIAEAQPPAPAWDNQRMVHPLSAAAAAVDVLFDSPSHSPQPETRSRPAQKKPRPRLRLGLSRIAGAIAAFIGSCFSTTRAIVTSLIALVVLAGLVMGLGIGAVGVAWVIMEEPPSSTYRSMTTSPQRTVGDQRKNGYLLLLGFDAPMDQDPTQAGFERKPDEKDADRALACLGGGGSDAYGGQSNASAKVLNGWFKGSDPVGQFTSHRGTIEGWGTRAGGALGRYQQWHRLSFEDWGYGQTISPPCAAISLAHHLYVAEGFVQGTDIGVDRIETDMEAWRIVLGQARTLPVKTLALQAMNDDIAVVSGLLVQPELDGKYLGRLAKMVRPLDQNELSLRWPMQNELVSAAKTFDAKLKAERREEQTVPAAIASVLPLPTQRRLNRYAEYYEASYKAAGEGRHGALPKWSEYIRFPAKTIMDHLANPIENVVGLEPLAPWDLYNGLVVHTPAHLRLASLQAWIRRGPQEADLLPRIAKAGQSFYDPYTGLPMLVNLKKGLLYSVGHDGKDQDADPQSDVVVAIPVHQAVAATLKASAETAKSK